MNLIRPHLKVETVWADCHMLEFSLSASSEGFAGRANFYVRLDEASLLAKQIEGFPRTASDAREYEFGDTNMQGYGGARIRLRCKDGSGHLLVQVEVCQNPIGLKEVAESATIQFNTVPTEIDSFIEELLRMKEEVGAVAVLRSAT